MGCKMMWCIEIKGYNTVDIHGRVFTDSQEEAIAKLREIAFDDYRKLKVDTSGFRRWGIWIHETGMSASVCGKTDCADDWDQEIGVNYRIRRRRVPA